MIFITVAKNVFRRNRSDGRHDINRTNFRPYHFSTGDMNLAQIT